MKFGRLGVRRRGERFRSRKSAGRLRTPPQPDNLRFRPIVQRRPQSVVMGHLRRHCGVTGRYGREYALQNVRP